MSYTTKVTLSDGQLAIAADKNIILTKRAIIDTASALFNSLVNPIIDTFSNTVSSFESISASIPKITKGENYLGFPYVILDYPAHFEKENIFAIRTMFWWGNFISITVHLSGRYKLFFEENIYKNMYVIPDLFLCISENQWQHHFEESNYKKISTINNEALTAFQQKKFIKIALKYELHHWNMMQFVLPEGYKKINALLLP